MPASGRIRVGIAGAGYWGIHHVRVFAAEPRAEVTWLCDPAPEARARAQALAPTARCTADFEELLAAADVDAVVLATPAPSHARLTAACLDAGLHVLVEKPVALSAAEGATVETAAARSGKTVMVGHLMLFHPAVLRLRELLCSGELGELYYLHSTRVNLGRLRADENALWSFGPHDLSMTDFLLGGEAPVSVSARGASYLQPDVQDVVFLTLRYQGGQMANIHLSWLHPRKERRLTLVCSKKMAEFDDVSAEKLRIYDKGYDRPPSFTEFGDYLTIRQGDIHIPHLAMGEPLAAEARHFLDCISSGSSPRADLASALRIVRILEAATISLGADGEPVVL